MKWEKEKGKKLWYTINYQRSTGCCKDRKKEREKREKREQKTEEKGEKEKGEDKNGWIDG